MSEHSHQTTGENVPIPSARLLNRAVLQFALPPLVLSTPAHILQLALSQNSLPRFKPTISTLGKVTQVNNSHEMETAYNRNLTVQQPQVGALQNPDEQHFDLQVRKHEREYNQLRQLNFDQKVRIHHLEKQLRQQVQVRRISAAPPPVDDFYNYDDDTTNSPSNSSASAKGQKFSQFASDDAAIAEAHAELKDLRSQNDKLIDDISQLETAIDTARSREAAHQRDAQAAVRRETELTKARDAVRQELSSTRAQLARADARANGFGTQARAAEEATRKARAEADSAVRRAEALAMSIKRSSATNGVEVPQDLDQLFSKLRMPGAVEKAELGNTLERLRSRQQQLMQQGYVPGWRDLVREVLDDCARALACSAGEVAAKRRLLGIDDLREQGAASA